MSSVSKKQLRSSRSAINMRHEMKAMTNRAIQDQFVKRAIAEQRGTYKPAKQRVEKHWVQTRMNRKTH